MNKKWKKGKKSLKNSPDLFEDEELGTSSSDEVKMNKLSATPHSISCKDHSTPIRRNFKTDSSDSPDLNYNESPIEPLTQNPPNEVGWNYQRPINKEEDCTSDSTSINNTPKRSALLSKKRNSNSPLLYKPLKKKLIQEEQKENMAGFIAELKAIEIKAKQIVEKNVEIPQNTENIESQLVVEMDSQPLNDSDIKLQVSVNTDESPGQNKIITANKKYNALLDDSIEDIMVLCSQEVEEKEFGCNKMQYPLQPPINISREKKSPKSSPDSSVEKIYKSSSKETVYPANNSEKVISDTSSKNSSANKGESCSLEIPDDSFDEFFVCIDDKDLCKSENTEVYIDRANKVVKPNNKHCIKSTSALENSVTSKSSTVQNKFFQSKNSMHTMQSKIDVSVANCNYVNCSQVSNALIQNKVVNTKANFGYLNKNYTKSISSSGFNSQSQTSSYSDDKNNDTRLFKAKSFSDSNFLQQSNSINNFDSNYGSNSNFSKNSTVQQRQNKNSVVQNSESTYYGSESSTESKGWRRAHSSSSINKSNNNSQQSSTNKLNSNEESSQSVFTAAEIERKRQEAIMRRKAILKMKFNNASSKRPMQNSVKR